MAYKHSPANAKMSAFMNKMNNTAKSPARQSEEEDTRSDDRKLIDSYNAASILYRKTGEGKDTHSALAGEMRAKGFNTGFDDTDDPVAYKQLRTGKRERFSGAYSGPTTVDRESVQKRIDGGL
jgi:hypothetical protein